MRKAALLFAILLTISASGAPAQKIIPKTEAERRGAESYNKAVEAFSAGDYAASIPLFLAADSLIGDKGILPRTKLRFALATAYLGSHQPAPAFEWFARVAGEDSTYPFANYQTAESARLAGKTDEALKYYHLALSQAAANQKPAIFQRIGELLEKKKNVTAALEAYNQALTIQSVPAIRLLRGLLFDSLAEPLDHASDENFNVEAAIKDSTLTEDKVQKAIELREKAQADYRAAAAEASLADRAGKLAERSEAILQNDRLVLSEMKYNSDNEN